MRFHIAEVRRVGRVPVVAATNAQNRTGLFPDPLPLPCPLDGGGERLAEGITSAFWITAVVANSATPGKRQGRVELRAGNAVVATLRLEVRVWSFSVLKQTQVTDSAINNLDLGSWRDGQHKLYPGRTRAEVSTRVLGRRTARFRYLSLFPTAWFYPHDPSTDGWTRGRGRSRVFEYSSTRPNISESHSETRVLEYPLRTPFSPYKRVPKGTPAPIGACCVQRGTFVAPRELGDVWPSDAEYRHYDHNFQ